jgi:hypothetical protein
VNYVKQSGELVVSDFPSREIMNDVLHHKVQWTMFTYAEAMMLALDVALMVYGCV